MAGRRQGASCRIKSSDLILEMLGEFLSERCVDEMRAPADESYVDRDQRRPQERAGFEYYLDRIRCRHIVQSCQHSRNLLDCAASVAGERHQPLAERSQLPAHRRTRAAGESPKRQVGRVRRCGTRCCGSWTWQGHPMEGRREEAPTHETAASSARVFHQQRRRSPSLLPRA